MGESSPTPSQLMIESWTMYSIGLVLIILRMFSRRLVLGAWRNLQAEDYLMMVDAAVYTVLMAAINVSGRTATNLMAPGEFATLTPADIHARIYGSKIVILLEQAMLVTTWLTKGCMLMLYHRLSQRLPHQFVIKLVSVYVVLGFVAVELSWFLSCRPLKGYWALPVPDPQCATYQHYSIVQAVFNLTSDIMMLSVGIPLLLKAKVELKKKLLLVGIFSLGIFVILAAVLNKYYNFSNSLTTVYMLWYIRESSTAIYVSNIPMLWPLVRRYLKVGSFAGSSGHGYVNSNSRGSGAELSRIRHTRKGKSQNTMAESEVEQSPSSSQERINRSGEAQLEIETRVSFTVEEGQVYGGENPGFDVERYGDARYKASISAGNPPAAN